MTRLTFDITMSLDGFIAGPTQTLEQPLGNGGERLHEWMVGLATFRERHGLSGGTINADAEVVEESLSTTGAVLMGRRMFSGGEGPGKMTSTRKAGGEMTRPSACRYSSSRTTLERPCPSKEERRSPSSPTGSRRRSSRLG
jgi:dihydrofolate reductase